MTHQEAIDALVNGNISAFKAWLKQAKKMDLLNAIEYYSGNFGNRHIIINTMRAYLEKGEK